MPEDGSFRRIYSAICVTLRRRPHQKLCECVRFDSGMKEIRECRIQAIRDDVYRARNPPSCAFSEEKIARRGHICSSREKFPLSPRANLHLKKTRAVHPWTALTNTTQTFRLREDRRNRSDTVQSLFDFFSVYTFVTFWTHPDCWAKLTRTGLLGIGLFLGPFPQPAVTRLVNINFAP